jgi:Lrp/AsnC family leucine-responsive transcriptional regulator
MEFDRYDARILAALQRDGRLSVVELAESIGLSAHSLRTAHQGAGIGGAIEGYAAILNPTRIGLGVLAIVQVKLTEHTDETVAKIRKGDTAHGRGHQVFRDDRQL